MATVATPTVTYSTKPSAARSPRAWSTPWRPATATSTPPALRPRPTTRCSRSPPWRTRTVSPVGWAPPPPDKNVSDVALTGTIAPAAVAQGGSATINVTVANLGTTTETFGVTLADGTDGGTIGSQTVSLGPGANTSLSFSWGTTT